MISIRNTITTFPIREVSSICLPESEMDSQGIAWELARERW
jgi:hypothetical protein